MTTTRFPRWVEPIDGININTGEFGRSIAHDNNNNIYICGTTTSGNNTIVIGAEGIPTFTRTAASLSSYVIKYNYLGEFQWFQWIDNTGTDEALSITCDRNNNIFVTGYSNSTRLIIDGTTYIKPITTTTNEGIFIIKFNDAGTAQWLRWIDGATNERGAGVDCGYDNIYITGFSNSSSITLDGTTYNKPNTATSNNGIILVKLNQSGDFISLKWIDGSDIDLGVSVSVYINTSNEDIIYLVGTVISATINIDGTTYTKPGSNTDSIIIKFLENGTLDDLKWISGANNENVLSIYTDNNGGYAITGEATGNINLEGTIYTRPTATTDAFIIRYNSSGVFQWLKWVGGEAIDSCTDIKFDSNNDIFVSVRVNSTSFTLDDTTYTESGLYIIKLNESNGVSSYVQAITGINLNQSINITIDNEDYVYLIGSSNRNTINIISPTEDNMVYIINHNTTNNSFGVIKLAKPDEPKTFVSCISNQSVVNIVDGKILLNNDTTYVSNRIYGLYDGTYVLKNIPENNPLAIINRGLNSLISYTGDNSKKSQASVNGITYDFYYGDITITVNGDFRYVGLYSLNNGYMGSRDFIAYSSYCIRPEASYCYFNNYRWRIFKTLGSDGLGTNTSTIQIQEFELLSDASNNSVFPIKKYSNTLARWANNSTSNIGIPFIITDGQTTQFSTTGTPNSNGGYLDIYIRLVYKNINNPVRPKVNGYGYLGNGSSTSPTEWSLSGSNDQINWILLDEVAHNTLNVSSVNTYVKSTFREISSQMIMEYNSGSDKTITLPLYNSLNLVVDWGDLTSNSYITPTDSEGDKNKVYDNDAYYIILLYGTLEKFGNGREGYPNVEKITSILSFGNLGITSLSGAFKDAINLTSIPASLPSTITDLSHTFNGATNMNSINLLNWDFSNVSNVSYMLFGATKFNQDIQSAPNFNPSKNYYILYNAKKYNKDSLWLDNKILNLYN